MKQASKRTNTKDRKDGSGTPAFRDVAKLRAAYEAEDGRVRRAADHFEASHSTVRRWLIKYGIYTPEQRDDRRLADLLEEADSIDEVLTDGGEIP